MLSRVSTWPHRWPPFPLPHPKVTICGGFVFLFFALTGLFMDDSEDGEDLADKIQNVFAGAATPADDVAE